MNKDKEKVFMSIKKSLTLCHYCMSNVPIVYDAR